MLWMSNGRICWVQAFWRCRGYGTSRFCWRRIYRERRVLRARRWLLLLVNSGFWPIGLDWAVFGWRMPYSDVVLAGAHLMGAVFKGVDQLGFLESRYFLFLGALVS